MRITPPFRRYLFEWHRWFAWRPVWVEDTLVWLEMVERRKAYDTYTTSTYYYRFLEDPVRVA